MVDMESKLGGLLEASTLFTISNVSMANVSICWSRYAGDGKRNSSFPLLDYL